MPPGPSNCLENKSLKFFLDEKQVKPLYSNRDKVYKKKSLQPSFPNLLLPFEDGLKANNPWIVMADLIPWDEPRSIQSLEPALSA